MIQIIDLDGCPEHIKSGTYGGTFTLKAGVTYQGETWMVKVARQKNGIRNMAPLSEYLGSHIFQLLGIAAQDTFMAEYGNRLAVACRDFAPNWNLFEMSSVKNCPNEYLDKSMEKEAELAEARRSDRRFMDLDSLMLCLDYNPILQYMDGDESQVLRAVRRRCPHRKRVQEPPQVGRFADIERFLPRVQLQGHARL